MRLLQIFRSNNAAAERCAGGGYCAIIRQQDIGWYSSRREAIRRIALVLGFSCR